MLVLPEAEPDDVDAVEEPDELVVMELDPEVDRLTVA